MKLPRGRLDFQFHRAVIGERRLGVESARWPPDAGRRSLTGQERAVFTQKLIPVNGHSRHPIS
jgi:hypothetical protein